MHSPALLFLCLLLWGPAVGYAQAPGAPPPPVDAPTLPPLVTAPEEPEAPPEEESFSGGRTHSDASSDLILPRMILSPLLGGAAAGGGAILGFILGAVLSSCAPFDGGCGPWALLVPTIGLGWAAGSFTVYGMGTFLEGQGTLGSTMVGGILGMGVGIAVIAVSQGTAWYAAPLAPGLGAAIAYEISNSYVRSLPVRDEFAGIQLMPVLSTTREGGLLGGLAGRF